MNYLEVQYSQERSPETAYPRRLIDHLSDRLDIRWPDRVVDLGCGRGDFTKEWRNRGLEVTALDREPGPQTDCTLDLAADPFPLPDAAYDVVFTRNLIEHLWDPSHLLEESRRVLKSGGALVIMCPDWRSQMRTFYDDYTHVRPYDVVSLADLLNVHGFIGVEVERFYQYPPFWRSQALAGLAAFWRGLAPTELSLWLSKRTGLGFFRWASHLSLLGVAFKP